MVTRRRAGLVAAGLLGVTILSGCRSNGVDAAPLQSSIGRAFSNLYVLQQVEEGHPRPSLRSLDTSAACQKGTPSTPQSGAGNDWVCQVTYLVAGPATPVVAMYNVNVQTSGCYSADGDGPLSVNGYRTITGVERQQVLNPLWLIDGCFDTT